MARIVSPTMPSGAHALGDVWYHTLSGLTFEWQRTAAGFGVWVQTIIAGPPTVSTHAPSTSGTPLCTSSPLAPDNPDPCDLWYHTESGIFFIYYDDGDTRQWVTTQPTKLGDIIVVTGPAGGDLAGSYPNPTIRPDVELTRPTTETLPASGVDTLELVPAQWVNDKFQALPVTMPPSGPAGGALNGTYPNPGLAVPYPTTLPPSGPAGGDLAGSYPNPTARAGLIPTTLPPSGPAGGALNGTYPNPSLAVPYPTTLPPSGVAGGALAGTYPNPTLVGGPLSNYALTSALPTTLPPNGPAGGHLAGTYPNPTIKPSATNLQVLTTVGGVATWAAPSGGASISVGTTPPVSPTAGALWWNSELGTMFIYYNDGNTTQWVPAAPPSTVAAVATPILQAYTSTAALSALFTISAVTIAGGTQIFSSAFTALKATNRIRVRCGGYVMPSAATTFALALFIDGASAPVQIVNDQAFTGTAVLAVQLVWFGTLAAGAHTFSVRIGASSGNLTLNQSGQGSSWTFEIEEVPT